MAEILMEIYPCYSCKTIINSNTYNRCFWCDSVNHDSGLLCDSCIEKHLKTCINIEGD